MAEPRPYPTNSPTPFSLATRRQHGTVVVEIEGELDELSCGRLQESLLRLLEGGEREVVLDLARLRFCDATGLRTLTAAAARFDRSHGELRLRAPADPVDRLLEGTGIDVVGDEEDAKRAADRAVS